MSYWTIEAERIKYKSRWGLDHHRVECTCDMCYPNGYPGKQPSTRIGVPMTPTEALQRLAQSIGQNWTIDSPAALEAMERVLRECRLEVLQQSAGHHAAVKELFDEFVEDEDILPDDPRIAAEIIARNCPDQSARVGELEAESLEYKLAAEYSENERIKSEVWIETIGNPTIDDLTAKLVAARESVLCELSDEITRLVTDKDALTAKLAASEQARAEAGAGEAAVRYLYAKVSAQAEADDPIDSVSRLRAWIRDYGHEKQPAFIADLTKVLGELKSLGSDNHRLRLEYMDALRAEVNRLRAMRRAMLELLYLVHSIYWEDHRPQLGTAYDEALAALGLPRGSAKAIIDAHFSRADERLRPQQKGGA